MELNALDANITPMMDQIIEDFQADEEEQASTAKMLNKLSAKDLDTQAQVA